MISTVYLLWLIDYLDSLLCLITSLLPDEARAYLTEHPQALAIPEQAASTRIDQRSSRCTSALLPAFRSGPFTFEPTPHHRHGRRRPSPRSAGAGAAGVGRAARADDPAPGAWTRVSEYELPLSPRLLGKPGVGKTTLAAARRRSCGVVAYVLSFLRDTHDADLGGPRGSTWREP